MELVILGSMAFDDIETTGGTRKAVLGGSGSHCALAASLHAKVGLVGVVGEDFPDASREALRGHGIDLTGVETRPGKTLRWSCRYEADMNIRHTTGLELNVLEDFDPVLPESYRSAKFVFLGNDSPARQRALLKQFTSPRFVVCDTMNHWINSERDELDALLREVDGLVINDEEARLLTGQENLIAAGNRILDLGPRVVLLKKGEHGAFLFSAFAHYAIPAYPLDHVVDPTGAGDSFAGGLMGHLASRARVTVPNLKKAMAHGTITASFTVQGFGPEGLLAARSTDIENRYENFIQFITP